MLYDSIPNFKNSLLLWLVERFFNTQNLYDVGLAMPQSERMCSDLFVDADVYQLKIPEKYV